MLTLTDMHPYQHHAVEHAYINNFCALFLGLGLGKSITTLTVVNRLMYEDLEVSKTLIIAPKRVAEDTWPNEVLKWAHTAHLRVSVVLGTEKARKAALRAKADVFVINRENVSWLVALCGSKWPFQLVVVDELSSFKNAGSQRFKALRSVRPQMSRVIGLTGTPAPNGLINLWSQLYLLDQGERLGKTKTDFTNRYFNHSSHGGGPNGVYEIKIPDTTVKGMKSKMRASDTNPYAQMIYDKISDICISMKAEDYLDLPKRIDRINRFHLAPEVMTKYREFEKTLVMEMPDEDVEVTALSAASLSTKLRQFTNGAIYDTEKDWHELHDEKIEALVEDIEAANGEPVLVFYQFKHDLERLENRLKSFKPERLSDSATIKRWNEGKIQILLAHPQSAGHGLNLQYGGHLLFWFGGTFDLEIYEQGLGRVDRQGQRFPVISTRLIAAGTIDEEILKSNTSKAGVQDAVMAAVKAIVKKYKP